MKYLRRHASMVNDLDHVKSTLSLSLRPPTRHEKLQNLFLYCIEFKRIQLVLGRINLAPVVRINNFIFVDKKKKT